MNPHHRGGQGQQHEDQQLSADRQVTFTRRGVMPAPGVYVTLDDQLRLRMWAPAGPFTVNVSLRWQNPDGRIIPEFFTLTGSGGGLTPTTQILNPAEGFLLSATASSPGVAQGAMFVVLDIIRGQGSGDLTQGQILISGYPGSVGAEGFPGSAIASPTDGRGRMLVVSGGAPAAGAEFSISVPAGREWIFRGLSVNFVTSATVANRQPSLVVRDSGGNVFYRSGMGGSVPASQNTNVAWGAGGAQQLGNPTISLGFIQECRLLPTHQIASVTGLLQAGDQYGTQTMLVEEFIDT